MNIGITLLIQIVFFALFIYFFKKVLWGPLMGIMEARQTRISEGLAAAERGSRELAEADKKVEAELREAREQAQELLANAQKQANDNIEHSREEARKEGERQKEAAREEIDQAISHAKDELRREVGQLAVSGAERILKREVDAKAHNDILDDLVGQIR